MMRMEEGSLPIYKVSGRLFLQGLSISFNVLWLALAFSGIFESHRNQGSLIDALMKAAMTAAGFLLILLADRYARRAQNRWIRLGVLSAMVVLGTLVHLLPLKGVWTFALAFVGVALAMAQLLPFFKQDMGGSFFAGLLSSALICTLALGMPGHTLLAAFPQSVPLRILSGLLLAALGFLTARPLLHQAKETPFAPSGEPGDAPAVLPLMAAYCVVALIACIFMTLMLAVRWGDALSVSLTLRASVVLVFTALLAGSFLLIMRKKYWLFSYTVLVSFLLGVLTLFFSDPQDLLGYLSNMFMVAAIGGLVPLLMLLVCQTVSKPNRPLGVAMVFVALFSLLLVFDRPLIQSLSLRLQDIEWLMLGVPTLVILLLPMLMRTGDGTPAPSVEGPGSDMTAETPDSKSATQEAIPSEDFANQLTNAEKRVYELILQGYSNQQIADMLYISINTVKFHIRNILSKGGVQKKSQLISKYVR